MKQKNKTRYEIFSLILLTTVIIITILVIYIINIKIPILAESFKEVFTSEIEKNTGYKLSYTHISPAFLNSIQIHNVKISDNSSDDILTLGSVKFKYSILSLIKDFNKPINCIQKIIIRKADIRLTQNNISNKFIKKNEQKKSIELPNIDIEIINSNIRYEISPTSTLSVYTHRTKLSFYDSLLSVKSNNSISYESKKKSLVSTNVRINGNIKNLLSLNEALFYLDFVETSFNNINIKRQIFSLSHIDNSFNLIRQDDGLPILLNLKYKNGSLNLKTNINNLSIASILNGKIPNNIPTNITNIADIQYDTKKGAQGTIYGSVFFANLFPTGASVVEYSVTALQNTLHLNRIKLRSVNNDGYLHLTGKYILGQKYPNLLVTLENFKIFTSNVDSVIEIKSDADGVSLQTDSLKSNNIDLGSFEYAINNQNEISTKTPFNDLYISSDNISGLHLVSNKFRILPFLPKEARALAERIYAKTNITISKNNSITGNLKLFNKESQILSLDPSITKNNINIQNINFFENKNNYSLSLLSTSKKKNMTIALKNQLKSYYYYTNSENGIYTLNDGKSLYLYFNNHGSLSLMLQDFNIPFIESDIKIDAIINSNINKGNISDSNIKISNIQGIQKRKASIYLDFFMNNSSLNVNNILYEDIDNKIQGSLESKFENSTEEIYVEGTGLLTDDNKNESYSVNFKLLSGILNARFFVTNMHFNKLAGKESAGFINLRVGLKGPLRNPIISIEGNTKNAQIKNNKIRAFFIIKKENEHIQIDNFIFESGNLVKILIKKSEIQLDKTNIKEINLNGDFYSDFLEKKIKTSFKINGSLSSLDKFLFNVILNESSIAFTKQKRIIEVIKNDNFALRASKNGDLILIESTDTNFIRLSMYKNTINGSLFYNDARVIAFNAGSNIDNLVTGSIELHNLPINIANIITRPHVKFIDGFLNGKCIITGQTSSPEFYGKLGLSRGEILIPDYIEKPISNISAFININKRKINVINVSGNSAGGLVNGYGEVVFGDTKIFESYNFIVSSEIVPGRFKYSFVDIAGKASIPEFNFTGRPGHFGFLGTIVVDQASINISNFSSNTEKISENSKKKAPIFANLNFITGSKVEVTYPLINGKLMPDNQLSLEYSGVDDYLNLIGNIKIRTGKINYLNKIFNITDATVRFDGGSGFINPELNIISKYSTRDSKRNKVDVFLTISDRLSSFNTSFSSTPQLSEYEINQILGLGFESGNSDDNVDISGIRGLESLQNTTNYIGNTFLFNPIENYVRRTLNLDVFSFNSFLFGNVLTSDKTLIDMLDNSSLTIGKYLTDGFYLESLMTFNKNNDISGRSFMPIPETDFGLNLKLQVLLELPFISLGYSFQPRDITNITDAEQKISIETSFKF